MDQINKRFGKDRARKAKGGSWKAKREEDTNVKESNSGRVIPTHICRPTAHDMGKASGRKIPVSRESTTMFPSVDTTAMIWITTQAWKQPSYPKLASLGFGKSASQGALGRTASESDLRQVHRAQRQLDNQSESLVSN